MNNSQSSDVFSGSGHYIFEDHPKILDIVAYNALVKKAKLLLSKNEQIQAKESTFNGTFSSILDICGSCITQSLDLVNISLNEEVNLAQLCEHLNNAVDLLRMLCGFLKEVTEVVSMNCSNMKTFPTATGRIILSVFTHCKESESIYGNNLKTVESQLKDLFRNCHELQMIYLMALGKQFIFDLTEHEQLSILVEALDINLKIGEIVQTLDVKTMAEQWKAYTIICEKYTDFLMDQYIYEDCTKVLCKMIENNVWAAVEIDQEDKIILRSLKVASFAIKILIRVCTIFKYAMYKNYDHTAQLLFFINIYNSAYLECVVHKSDQFVNLFHNNVTAPAEVLLKELLLDENFCNYLFNYEMESIAKTDKLLGYILVIIAVMESVLQGNNTKGDVKHQILDCIYQCLPNGHIWFNMGLKFKSAGGSSLTCGLYERLLSTTFAMASTLDEISYLERKMYDSLLGTNCYAALFSSNLWVLLAKSSPRQFLVSQVISLCKVYQTLEVNKMFSYSPQKVHLSHTLRQLFKTLNSENKTRICEQFNIFDINNYGLWSVLEIRNLDRQNQEELLENIKEELRKDLSKICPDEIEILIKVMELAATCLLNRQDLALEDCIVTAWMKWCPVNRCLVAGASDQGSTWRVEYIGALATLTKSMMAAPWETANIVKILHVLSSLIERGNAEVKLVLKGLLIDLLQQPCHDENKHLVDTLLMKTITLLLQDTDSIVQNNFWDDLRKCKEHANTSKILKKIFTNEVSLRDKRRYITRNDSSDCTNLKEDLMSAVHFQFNHKCIEYENVIELSDSVSVIEKTSSNNFDFADIDSLFEPESDSEPACKKVKLDTNEAEVIIARLEKDVSLLSNIKENVTSDCKVRIRVLCEKLVNLID